MNKIHAVLFALMMLTVSLAGCFGGDDPVEDETPVETLDDWQVHFASSAADLPTCDSATDGRLYYVDADSEFQVCTSSGWDVIDVSGPAGQDGADGTSGTNGVLMALEQMALMVLTELMVTMALTAPMEFPR